MSKVIIFFMFLTTIMSLHVFREDLQTVSLVDFQNAQLKRHNLYRARHGSSNISLNQTLNAAAQQHAEKLAIAHRLNLSPQAMSRTYGENLYWNWKSPKLEYIFGTASDSWYNQVDNYDYSTGKSSIAGKPVSYFTAMIWKSVTSVGFGFAQVQENDGKAVYIVANYFPLPNIRGQYQENVLIPKQ